MSGRRNDNRILWNARGETMLMALVLLIVFMAVGASVLSAGAGSSAASSARIVERQVYYAARSMLDVLDESMRSENGALGRAIQNEAYGALVGSGANAAIPETTQSFTVSLSGAPEGLEPAAGTLTYSGSAIIQELANEGKQAAVNLSVKLSFDLTYKNKTYTMLATYSFDGFALSANGGDPVWTGEWKVQVR